jgi:hypothetical protein
MTRETLAEHAQLVQIVMMMKLKAVFQVVLNAMLILHLISHFLQVVKNVRRVISRKRIGIQITTNVNHVNNLVEIVLLQKTVQHVILPTINGMML